MNLWLPVDSTLGPELARATDAALSFLAREAQRIKWVTICGAALLCASALILAIASDSMGWGAAGLFSTVVAAVAFTIGLQKRKLWDGSPAWMRWYWRPIDEPSLPAEARVLLAELRAGTRHARFSRGQSGELTVLPVLLMRGPFGALILSSDPQVQGLALWDWFGGDRLSVEIEQLVPRNSEPPPQPDASAEDHVAVASQREIAAGPKLRSSQSNKFNRLVLLGKADLDAILQQTYPEAFEADCEPDKSQRRARLIVRTFQIARERLFQRRFKTVTDLRNDVLRRLAAEGIDNFGLSDDGDSVSSSWMDKALSRSGYPAIEKDLREAAARSEAK